MKHSIYAAFKVLGEGKFHVVLLFLSSRDEYKLGQKISDEEFKNLPITYIESLGKRNYFIKSKAE